MNTQPTAPSKPPTGRTRLLQAAVGVIRAQGYSATSVDDLCGVAGVTKGAFFHHFASKEAMAVAAAWYWSETTGAMFARAPYHDHADPLDRVLGYIDFRASLLKGRPEIFTCLAGTMVQEVFASSDPIRVACNTAIRDHAARLEADIDAALVQHKVTGMTAHSLALHTQAVVQGAFILAKAHGGPDVAIDSVAHLRRYILLLFHKTKGETCDVQ